MCGRFTLGASQSEIEKRFNVSIKFDYQPRYNAAPTQSLAIITARQRKEVQLAKWGLRPSWWQGGLHSLINIRVETLLEKKTFNKLLKTQRCLILADGFYEWHKEDGNSQPYYFKLASKELFAFPGLWDCSDNNKSQIFFSILTCPANENVQKIHHRMPCILRPEQESIWLEDGFDVRILSDLAKSFKDIELVYFPVGQAVNSPTNDHAFLLENKLSEN